MHHNVCYMLGISYLQTNQHPDQIKLESIVQKKKNEILKTCSSDWHLFCDVLSKNFERNLIFKRKCTT